MNKWLDNIYKYSIWIILVLSLLAYVAYYTLTFDGTLQSAASDWRTWVHIAFVIYLNITMVTGAYDSGTTNGLSSPEFIQSDKLNNVIIGSVNNEMKDFRYYIKTLNKHELITIQEEYLFSVGDKQVEDLSPKELKKYKKLKPIQHNIYGFNLPLYYEMTRNGKISYQASVKKNQGKRSAQINKVFTGLMFGAMTVNMSVQLGNLGTAFTSLLVISAGLMITFLLSYVRQVIKYRFDIPKKVLLKHTLYKSYTEFKNGTHKLKIIEEEEKEEGTL